MNCYKKRFKKDPKVRAIHAGLECGLIGDKIPGMDMISFGPTLRGVHSPDERCEIATVQMFWDFMCDILKNVPTTAEMPKPKKQSTANKAAAKKAQKAAKKETKKATKKATAKTATEEKVVEEKAARTKAPAQKSQAKKAVGSKKTASVQNATVSKATVKQTAAKRNPMKKASKK